MFVTEYLSLALPFSDFAVLCSKRLVRIVGWYVLSLFELLHIAMLARKCTGHAQLLDPLFTMLVDVAHSLGRGAGPQYFSPVSVSENFYLPCKAL